jgi:hypothetical protein
MLIRRTRAPEEDMAVGVLVASTLDDRSSLYPRGHHPVSSLLTGSGCGPRSSQNVTVLCSHVVARPQAPDSCGATEVILSRPLQCSSNKSKVGCLNCWSFLNFRDHAMLMLVSLAISYTWHKNLTNFLQGLSLYSTRCWTPSAQWAVALCSTK